MHGSISTRTLALLTAAGGLVALVIAFTGSLLAGAIAGVLVLATALLVARDRLGDEGNPPNPARRRFLAGVAGIGLAMVGAGDTLGRVLRRLTAPDPRPALDAMARNLGADAVELVRRTYHPDRSGDLQLLLAPFNSSNYANESMSLMKDDPRTSHASVWMYLERVPIVVYAPGLVSPSDHLERVTLADLAPTTAHLMGFDFAAADGVPLPGIPSTSPRPPKLIVTFVIDGGGWNVLHNWDDPDPEKTAWPNLKRLMRGGAVYRNAIMGSFPAVTACAHATIGTGAFPRTHGISGHNIRQGTMVVKAYGEPGRADPSVLLVPTLADAWTRETGNTAWVGEIGYQIWHLGMLGHGGRPLGDKPVAVYYDEDRTGEWQPQNPELYRLPAAVPPTAHLDTYREAYASTPDVRIDQRFERFLRGGRVVCCSPPIITYQGDLIESTIESEGLGQHEATDLLYVNFKAPDYAGHVYNYLSLREKFALQAVDEQLGRLADTLEAKFAPGEFVLIATADHGQCPTPDAAGGVRLDPIQLEAAIQGRFGRSAWKIVTTVAPSEVFLQEIALADAGITASEIAASLRDVRYRDNIGPYVAPDAIEHDLMDRRIFAAVLPTAFIAQLAGADLSRYGGGGFRNSDPGIPQITW